MNKAITKIFSVSGQQNLVFSLVKAKKLTKIKKVRRIPNSQFAKKRAFSLPNMAKSQ